MPQAIRPAALEFPRGTNHHVRPRAGTIETHATCIAGADQARCSILQGPVRCRRGGAARVMRGRTCLRRRQCLGAIAALPAAVVAQPALVGRGPSVRISGTGAITGLLRLLGNEYMAMHRDERIEVLFPYGSTGALKALAEQAIDIAATIRAPTAAERAAGAGTTTWLARTLQVFAVHRNLGLDRLSMPELITLWSQQRALFPNGKRARPIQRPAESGTLKSMRQFSPELQMAMQRSLTWPGMLAANDESEALDLIEQTPGGIGTVSLSGLLGEGRPLVALTIGDWTPTVEHLEAQRYPAGRNLYLISRALPKPAVQSFMAFLRSPHAQQMLRQRGCSTRMAARTQETTQ